MTDSATEKRDAAYVFAKHVANVRYQDIPSEAVESTKINILTHLGTAVAASTTVPVCRQMMELAKEMGGKKESTIIAYGVKVPCYMAAFVNGALAHGLNFGDVAEDCHVHPGSTLLPAAFAVAERVGKVNGKEFITAFTLGTDIMVRLAHAIHGNATRDWQAYGWAPEQIFGYIPVAAVAGKLLGLDEDQIVRAFGLALCQTAGVMEIMTGVGVDKAIYPSFPAMDGVLAALMAQRGITGPKNSLDGRNGLFPVFFQGEYDSASLTQDLGKSFEGVTLGFYPYPYSVCVHPYFEIALLMAKEQRVRPEDVEAVTLFVGHREKEVCHYCDPLEIRRNPTNISEAQMSLPFPVAVALTKGKPRMGHFACKGIKDPDILRLSNKVVCHFNPKYGWKEGTEVSRPAIEIKLTDGRVLRSEQEALRYGNPKRPMSKEEHLEKFRDCVSYSARPLSKTRVENVIRMLTSLEGVDDVSRIIRLLSSD